MCSRVVYSFVSPQILSSLDSLQLEAFNALEQIQLKISRCESEPIKEIIHKHILELKDDLKSDRAEYDVS